MLRLCLLVVTFWAAALLASAATADDDLPPNLVTNPSLEDKSDNDKTTGWGGFYSNPADVYSATVVDGGRTGKKHFRIHNVKADPAGQFGAMPANRVPLDRTKRYVARGWVKVSGGERATADVKLHYYGAGGNYLGQTRIGFVSPGNDDWQLVTVTDHAADFPEAKLIGLAIACTGDAKADYDDLELLAFDKKTLPADFESVYGVTLSPQLAILARRVGTWNITTKIKPGDVWMPQGMESTGIETIRWTLGGQLLEGRQVGKDSGIEQLNLMTYDARDKVYRSWYFGVNGNIPRTNTLGKYDQATETITWENQPQDEYSVVARMQFIGPDAFQWSGLWKDKDGKVLMEANSVAKRRPADQTPPK